MIVEVASITDDGKKHTATKSEIEYHVQSSRGMTAMAFVDEEKAINWAEGQRTKHGNAAPSMKVVRRLKIQVDEVICYA